LAKADHDRDRERPSKKHGEDGRDRDERKHKKREEDSVVGKSEKSDRRRHGEDRDKTGDDGERRKKRERDSDGKRRQDSGDEDRESRHSKNVSCRLCCLHFKHFILFLVLCNGKLFSFFDNHDTAACTFHRIIIVCCYLSYTLVLMAIF